jgi:hypothetical protein
MWIDPGEQYIMSTGTLIVEPGLVWFRSTRSLGIQSEHLLLLGSRLKGSFRGWCRAI